MSDGDYDSGGGSFGSGYSSGGGGEVTYEGWFQRLSKAFVSVLIGIVLFLVAFPVLFWNEGNAVRVAIGLGEGKKAVNDTTVDKVDPALNGKLVHVTGDTKVNGVLTDPIFGIEGKGVYLARKVQIYQLKEDIKEERKKKLGGGEEVIRTPSYGPVWTDHPIDSSKFMNEKNRKINNGSMPVENWDAWATKVDLGAYTLPDNLIHRISGQVPVTLPSTVPDKLSGSLSGPVKVADNRFYIGEDPSKPNFNDVRVEFVEIKPGTVSIVASQKDNTFEAWKPPSGADVLLMEMGSKSAGDMFKSAEAANEMMLWIFRIVGFLLMVFGISMVFKPLVVFGDVIPFVGNLLQFGANIFAFFIAIPLTLITIAIGWVFARPLVGIGLLLAAGAMIFGIVFLVRGRKKPALAKK